ncbi:MAG: HigA family addiction module antitoxin [Paracraurococcus sp.]|jgi:antitoxin HigA-1
MSEHPVCTLEDVRAGRVDLPDDIEPGAEQPPPIPPGEILAEEFMAPLGLSANALALRVPANRVTAILHGRRGITADTALRLAAYFGTTPEFWLGLQQQHELEIAERAQGERIRREVLPRGHAGAD